MPLLVNHTTKTIHYHHHHHHHHHHHQDIGNWRILQSDWGKSISTYNFGTWILPSQNFRNLSSLEMKLLLWSLFWHFWFLRPKSLPFFLIFGLLLYSKRKGIDISKILKTDFLLSDFFYFFLFRPFEIQFHLPWFLLIEPHLINLKF